MIEVERGKAAGLILGLCGSLIRGIRLHQEGLQVVGPSSQEIVFSQFAGPITRTRWLWFHGLSVALTDGTSVRVLGLMRTAADRFVTAANEAWRTYIAELFQEIDPELTALSQVIERLSAP